MGQGRHSHAGTPLVVLNHRPAPTVYQEQTFVSTGIRLVEAVAAPAGTHLHYAVER